MILESTQHACVYSLLDGNIHSFVFLQNTEQAVDEFFDTLEIVIRQSTAETLLMYVDISRLATKLPSFSYTRTRLKRLFAICPNRPPARAVIVHNYGIVISSLQTFMKIIQLKRESVYRFVAASDEHIAFDWLLQQTN